MKILSLSEVMRRLLRGGVRCGALGLVSSNISTVVGAQEQSAACYPIRLRIFPEQSAPTACGGIYFETKIDDDFFTGFLITCAKEAVLEGSGKN